MNSKGTEVSKYNIKAHIINEFENFVMKCTLLNTSDTANSSFRYIPFTRSWVKIHVKINELRQ